MNAFKLDTSGEVTPTPDTSRGFTHGMATQWGDLSPFTQGYIEALFAENEPNGSLDTSDRFDLPHGRGGVCREAGFSDLAPETLARIITDCEAARRRLDSDDAEDAGAVFWRLRQEGHYVGGLINFPPLTVQLGDDGLIRFA